MPRLARDVDAARIENRSGDDRAGGHEVTVLKLLLPDETEDDGRPLAVQFDIFLRSRQPDFLDRAESGRLPGRPRISAHASSDPFVGNVLRHPKSRFEPSCYDIHDAAKEVTAQLLVAQLLDPGLHRRIEGLHHRLAVEVTGRRPVGPQDAARHEHFLQRAPGVGHLHTHHVPRQHQPGRGVTDEGVALNVALSPTASAASPPTGSGNHLGLHQRQTDRHMTPPAAVHLIVKQPRQHHVAGMKADPGSRDHTDHTTIRFVQQHFRHRRPHRGVENTHLAGGGVHQRQPAFVPYIGNIAR